MGGQGQIDKQVLTLKKYDAQVNAFLETCKEIGRLALSYMIGWVLENGYSYFAKSKLSPDVILAIGVCFRAADYYWHKYNKEITPNSEGKSLGLFRF